MYVVFTPNKVFVQFQVIDYWGDSTDFIILFSPQPRVSFKNYPHAKKPRARRERHRKHQNSKANIRPLTAYLSQQGEMAQEPPLTQETPPAVAPLALHSGFGLIPVEPSVQAVWLDENMINAETMAISTEYAPEFQGILGKYSPIHVLLEVAGLIASCYTGGLIHHVYLSRLPLLAQLKTGGCVKYRGFTVKEYFLVIYYLFFLPCKSLELFKAVNPREFAILINNLSKPSPEAILHFLKSQITAEVARQFHSTIYHYISHLDEAMCRILYFDEHLVPYQGRKKLAKGKSGTTNKLQKGFYRYYLTSPLFSSPVFSTFREGSSRLEADFFAILTDFEATTGCRGQVFIFDRGVKSPATLRELLARGQDFICWGIPYHKMETALKKRQALKLKPLWQELSAEIAQRLNPLQELGLRPEDRGLKQTLTRILPRSYLKQQLRLLQAKATGAKEWHKRAIWGIREIELDLEDLGPTRALVVETIGGKRMVILTSLKGTVASAVEIVLLLKKRQGIESFFHYKKEINGDRIFNWALEEKAEQKTPFRNRIALPSPEDMPRYETQMKRAHRAVNKLERTYKTYETQLKNWGTARKPLETLLQGLRRKITSKQAWIQELRALVLWRKKRRKPRYFTQFPKQMVPNFTRMTFINTIHDLYFVISRQIARDWATAVAIAQQYGLLAVKDAVLETLRNMMPYKLNQVLLKGSGKVYRDPTTETGLMIELNGEYSYRGENLLSPYVSLLNQFKTHLRYCLDAPFTMKYINRLERPQSPVKVV